MQTSREDLPTKVSHGKIIGTSELTQFISALGYQSDTAACYGYAGAGIPAVLLTDISSFELRLKWMRYIFDFAKTQSIPIPEALSYTLSQVSSAYHQRIISEIPACCQNIDFHYQPQAYKEVFAEGEMPKSQNVRKTLPYVLPALLGSQQIASSRPITGAYTAREFIRYFASLAGVLSIFNENIALLVSSIDHSLLLTYDYRKKNWVLIEIHHDIQIIQSSRTIATLVKHYFHNNKVQAAVLATELFALDGGAIHEILRCLYEKKAWQKIHTVSDFKGRLTDNNKATWAHVAAQNNDVETLKRINCLQGDLFEAKTASGQTPLDLAIEEGHAEAEAYLRNLLAQKIQLKHPFFGSQKPRGAQTPSPQHHLCLTKVPS